MLLIRLKKGLNIACLYMLLNKYSLLYFAGFPRHIGFYAVPSGHTAFAEELSVNKGGKGSVQFPLTQPVLYSLIEKMVIFRVKENQER